MNVSRELFKKVLDVLTDTREKSHHEERQQALLDMLSAGALDYLEDEVKLKAQNVGFYRLVKDHFRYSEKAKKYEKNLPLCFGVIQ